MLNMDKGRRTCLSFTELGKQLLGHAQRVQVFACSLATEICPSTSKIQFSCSFADLTMVLDPERSLKAEKTVIIADTIKHINQIRNENGRLQHDVHQLEVPAKPSSYEMC